MSITFTFALWYFNCSAKSCLELIPIQLDFGIILNKLLQLGYIHKCCIIAVL